jgi:hypothetical protein
MENNRILLWDEIESSQDKYRLEFSLTASPLLSGLPAGDDDGINVTARRTGYRRKRSPVISYGPIIDWYLAAPDRYLS